MKTAWEIIKSVFSTIGLIILYPLLLISYLLSYSYPLCCVLPLFGFSFTIDQPYFSAVIVFIAIGVAVLYGFTKKSFIPCVISAVCWIAYFIALFCTNNSNDIMLFGMLLASSAQFASWMLSPANELEGITNVIPNTDDSKSGSLSNNKLRILGFVVGIIFTIISAIMLIISINTNPLN